jgi:hypothetical protein
MRRRLFVISNPGAGLSHSTLIDDTLRALERAGAELTRVRPASIEAARRAAQEAAASDNYDAIVAAGGDGTIRHVAAALIDGAAPLGIIRSAPAMCWPTRSGSSLPPRQSRARCSRGRPSRWPARAPTASRFC